MVWKEKDFENPRQGQTSSPGTKLGRIPFKRIFIQLLCEKFHMGENKPNNMSWYAYLKAWHRSEVKIKEQQVN